MQELSTVLDTQIPSQRARTVVDDIVGPLDVLYEFGELDCAGSLETMNKPIALFGKDTSLIGSLSTGPKLVNLREKSIGDAIHGIIEGCEPTTGLR